MNSEIISELTHDLEAAFAKMQAVPTSYENPEFDAAYTAVDAALDALERVALGADPA